MSKCSINFIISESNITKFKNKNTNLIYYNSNNADKSITSFLNVNNSDVLSFLTFPIEE